ncbi:MAG: hypothetical protein IPP97_27895 [Candidatus Obscuribacter sp.]|nr:hypothetical protein [Candidatus Obscuribacter sp.]
MLVASKESIARVRGYSSPLLAATIVLTILYIFGTCIFCESEGKAERLLATPITLTPGRTTFIANATTVYLLVKTCDRSSELVSYAHPVLSVSGLTYVYRKPENRVPGFEFDFTGLASADTPHIFWLAKPEKVFDIYGDTTIHAAFCMTKGQRISLETKWLPDTLQKNRQLKLVRLGARTAGSSFYNSDYSIKAARFLSPGHLLKTDDLRLDDHDNSLLRSPLDLPVPLVGEGSQLRLTTTLIPGESIKSSMLQLPTTEAELARFLQVRNLAVTSAGPNLR